MPLISLHIRPTPYDGQTDYHKVASSNTSHIEAHAGFFRLLMNGIDDPYVHSDLGFN